MIFDTHAHYDDEAFDEDRSTLIPHLTNENIGHIVNIGTDIRTSKISIDLANQYDFIHAAVGIHPSESEKVSENDFEELKKLATHERVVAIGEIGLDYHWETPDRSVQKEVLLRQIGIAKELKLPMIFHTRDASAETMDIIKNTNAGECGGVIHCFSYSAEVAKEYVNMGFFIGIGGVITFKKAKKLIRVLDSIPMENVLIETDCPYMAPEPHRGKRNDSSFLKYVVEKVAELKGMTREEVENITWENACRMYKIKND